MFLAPFAALDINTLPLIANILGNLYLIKMLLCVWFFLLREKADFSVVIFLSSLIIIPTFYFLLGMETHLFILLVFLAILLLLKQNFGAAGLVSAFAYLARGDALLLLLIAPLFIIFINVSTSRLKELGCYFGSFTLIFAPWSLYSKISFGSYFPSTLNTKILQGAYKLLDTTYDELIDQRIIGESQDNRWQAGRRFFLA